MQAPCFLSLFFIVLIKLSFLGAHPAMAASGGRCLGLFSKQQVARYSLDRKNVRDFSDLIIKDKNLVKSQQLRPEVADQVAFYFIKSLLPGRELEFSSFESHAYSRYVTSVLFRMFINEKIFEEVQESLKDGYGTVNFKFALLFGTGMNEFSLETSGQNKGAHDHWQVVKDFRDLTREDLTFRMLEAFRQVIAAESRIRFLGYETELAQLAQRAGSLHSFQEVASDQIRQDLVVALHMSLSWAGHNFLFKNPNRGFGGTAFDGKQLRGQPVEVVKYPKYRLNVGKLMKAAEVDYFRDVMGMDLFALSLQGAKQSRRMSDLEQQFAEIRAIWEGGEASIFKLSLLKKLLADMTLTFLTGDGVHEAVRTAVEHYEQGEAFSSGNNVLAKVAFSKAVIQTLDKVDGLVTHTEYVISEYHAAVTAGQINNTTLAGLSVRQAQVDLGTLGGLLKAQVAYKQKLMDIIDIVEF